MDNAPAIAYSHLLKIKHKWPLLVRDIILMTQTDAGMTFGVDDIARSYELTPEEFVALTRLPAFQDIFRAEMERFKGMGPSAGYKLRTEALVTDLQERLYAQAVSGEMQSKDQLQFLSVLMKSIGLHEPEQQPAAAVNTAVNIAFNIPALPSNKKLAHLVAQPQNKVIDYTG